MFHRRALFSSTNEQGHTHCTIVIQQDIRCQIHVFCISIGNAGVPKKKDDYHNYAAGDSSNDNDHGGEDHDDDPAAELMILS